MEEEPKLTAIELLVVTLAIGGSAAISLSLFYWLARVTLQVNY